MEHDWEMDDELELDLAEQSVLSIERAVSKAIRNVMGDEFGEYDARVCISALVCLMTDIAEQAEITAEELNALVDLAMEDDDE